MEALVRHSWPGNIRELQNFVERNVILTSGNVLAAPLASLKHVPDPESSGAMTLEEAERDHICKALEQTNWVVAGQNGAAARLGIKRATLYFRMKKHGIVRSNAANFSVACAR
jgi:formate hydrogenlyase transcriptional activator